MKDPRVVEIEFLSALERDRPPFVEPSTWAKRLGVSDEFFRDLVFNLFGDHCLNGSASIDEPGAQGPYAGFDRSDLTTWARHSNIQSVNRLLNQNEFRAHINHRGRLRLWRMRDEMWQARRKDAFDLLWDKRHWNADLVMHLAMADAGSWSVVLFIDVDDFKAVNEKTSHVVGDQILTIVFQTVLDKIGGSGDAYRWGGDEVTVLVPGADVEMGNRIGEAIRAGVEEQCSVHEDLRSAGLRTTVSVGVGAFRGQPTPDRVTAEVAGLMKKVKAKGKNSVVADVLAFTQ